MALSLLCKNVWLLFGNFLIPSSGLTVPVVDVVVVDAEVDVHPSNDVTKRDHFSPTGKGGTSNLSAANLCFRNSKSKK